MSIKVNLYKKTKKINLSKKLSFLRDCKIQILAYFGETLGKESLLFIMKKKKVSKEEGE